MNQESKVDRDEKEDALSNLADAASQSFLGEVWYLVVSHKRWILLPIVIAIVVLGVLVMLSSSGVGPFIYTLF